MKEVDQHKETLKQNFQSDSDMTDEEFEVFYPFFDAAVIKDKRECESRQKIKKGHGGMQYTHFITVSAPGSRFDGMEVGIFTLTDPEDRFIPK